MVKDQNKENHLDLTVNKPTVSFFTFLVFLVLLAWPFMAMFAALGYEHAFKHAYKDTATYILLYYPIPLSIGIVGKYIARKMHAPIEIIFTGLMIISLGALIFVFVFAQKGVI